jgi:hypothetical protein
MRASILNAAGVCLAWVSCAAFGQGVAGQAGNMTQALAAMPLASFPQGKAMVDKAIAQLAPDVAMTFLNKDYENDVYAKEPVTGQKVRVSCVRFRATSGFRFAMDPPKYTLDTQKLLLTAHIAKIRADSLSFKFMLGPCAWVGGGYGVQLTDVKLTYKARPMLSFDDSGGCRLAWNNDPNSLTLSVGDLNILGMQNDLDKLAKDAAREAINFSLDAVFGSALRGELQKVTLNTCGSGKKR